MTDLPKTPSFRLDGRRALISGASRGIGLAGAVALAEAGAHVVLASRTTADLEDLAAGIMRTGGSAEVLQMDVNDLDHVAAVIGASAPFDILFNNAGVSRHKAMVDTTPEDYDFAMNINLRGAYFVAKATVKGMIEAIEDGRMSGASIIHTSSQMGRVGGIDRTVYAANKHAIEGLTKSMAIELAPQKIRVNAIAPTFIRTPFTASTFADPERVAWIESKIKLGRVGELEDIMGAVVFLASDAASLVTGSSLLIDGGWTAG